MSRIIRFQFSKGPKVQFLSHLDLVRTMERALRRAKLPIAYSGGFTPRPIMSFSYALPVGVLSIAEYGDFEFAEEVDPEEFVRLYNRHLPQGLEILQGEHRPERTPALMREINAASWELVLPEKNPEQVQKSWMALQGMDSFEIVRETKKGSRTVDIRPFLFELSHVLPGPQGTIVRCFAGLGNEANLRIEELGLLLDFAPLGAVITRTGQYMKLGDLYRPPLGNRG